MAFINLKVDYATKTETEIPIFCLKKDFDNLHANI